MITHWWTLYCNEWRGLGRRLWLALGGWRRVALLLEEI